MSPPYPAVWSQVPSLSNTPCTYKSLPSVTLIVAPLKTLTVSHTLLSSFIVNVPARILTSASVLNSLVTVLYDKLPSTSISYKLSVSLWSLLITEPPLEVLTLVKSKLLFVNSSFTPWPLTS